MPIPLMNFPILSPTGDMLDRAFSTNKSINDAISAKLQQQMQKEMMPYLGKTKEAELQNYLLRNEMLQAEKDWAGPTAQAEMQLKIEQANKQKYLNDLIRKIAGGGQIGQDVMAAEGSGLGMGGMSSDSELGNLMVRSMLGLPDETPMERARREMMIHQQNAMFNKDLERQAGTTTTISDTQNRLKGIEGVMPLLDQLLEMEVPGQSGIKVPFIKENDLTLLLSPDKQAAYKGKLSAAKESALAAMGLSPTVEGLATVEKIFGKQPGETDVAYKSRLAEEINTFIDRYEALGGQNKYERKEIVDAVKKMANPAKTGNFVRMRTPDGRILNIPKEKAKEAEKRGASYAE